MFANICLYIYISISKYEVIIVSRLRNLIIYILYSYIIEARSLVIRAISVVNAFLVNTNCAYEDQIAATIVCN